MTQVGTLRRCRMLIAADSHPNQAVTALINPDTPGRPGAQLFGMGTMRKTIVIAILTAAGAFSAPAWGDTTPDPFSGNVQFMTNYVGRGLAQSLGQPGVEGEI